MKAYEVLFPTGHDDRSSMLGYFTSSDFFPGRVPKRPQDRDARKDEGLVTENAQFLNPVRLKCACVAWLVRQRALREYRERRRYGQSAQRPMLVKVVDHHSAPLATHTQPATVDFHPLSSLRSGTSSARRLPFPAGLPVPKIRPRAVT